MILNCCIIRRACVLFIIMLFFILQISVMMTASVLPEDITSGKDVTFLNTISSVANDSALETSGSERIRGWASVISVILFALRNPVILDINNMEISSIVSRYEHWNSTIGDVLSALPKADMVALK